MVNFEWYRSFIEVYRVGTASGAAQILHLTQPAVSQHIAALESALGTGLFERTPRKMLPTEAAKRLYNQIAASVETLESIPTRNSNLETQQIIRLGSPQEFFTERILNQLPQDDKILYTVKFGLTQELIAQLQEGQLDLVVATQKITKSDIEYQLLFEESFWLVAPLTVKVPISVEDLTPLEAWLRTQPLIAYSEELPIIRRFWRVVFGRRIDINPKLIIPDLRGIREAIAYGFGFSVLPDYLCQEWVDNQRLTLVLKPAKSVKNYIWLAFRKSERQAQKIQTFLELLC
ncbi:MAG: LysR family transcriptional regulator [Cyanomargarita calcarea GSE-NOS-MK-12-04C]|uniref:LysR family transcriptional regulator n=1 Tax=Cyanomargarita calcarea GSE-NOS-MK-12-04C TaxID=2839659 RepID=A0A951QN18_9CYAN|nr:LysR family transcriptional regulator [Cyanomargarita calcarea GSE-NOS-MK-12-04C]